MNKKKIIIILSLICFIFGILQANKAEAVLITEKLKGRILLQVEGNGEAWYVNPDNGVRYFMGRPLDAFNLMSKLGKGITNKDLEKIPIGSSDSVNNPYSDNSKIDKSFGVRHAGKIFLQVESAGEAWYIDPLDNKRYLLGRPLDAFNIMKSKGLGISNSDLIKIPKMIDNFIVIDGTHKKDKSYVYIHGKKMENSDPDTYELLAVGYTKDKNNVYFNETIIKGADPETFKVTGYWTGEDKNYEYYRDNPKSKEINMDSWEVHKNKKCKFNIKYPKDGWKAIKDEKEYFLKLFRNVGYWEDDAQIYSSCFLADYESALKSNSYFIQLCEGSKKINEVAIGDTTVNKIDCERIVLISKEDNLTILFSGYKEEKDIIDAMISSLKFY